MTAKSNNRRTIGDNKIEERYVMSPKRPERFPRISSRLG